MQTRSDLHTFLESKLTGVSLYFQPPENTKILYPCLIYDYSKIHEMHANNQKYIWKHSYSLTYITKDPSDSIVSVIYTFPYVQFDRHYVADNLHHYSFTIYY